MAVDLSIPNSILQAYATGANLRRRQTEFTAEQEMKQKQLDQARQQFEEELSQRKEQFNTQMKLAQATHDLAIMQTQQSILGKYLSGEEPLPPGSQVTPAFKTPGNLPTPAPTVPDQTNLPADVTTTTPLGRNAPQAQMMPIANQLEGLQPGQQQVSIPGMPQAVTPTPEEFQAAQIKKIGAIARAQEAPKAEAGLAEKALQAQTEASKLFYEEKGRNDRGQANIESREKIAKAQIDAANYRAQLRGTTDKAIQRGQSIANQFRTSDIVKNFNTNTYYTNIANNLANTGADDTALIYAVVRAVDPNRVTDSEMKIAQEEGQSLATRFGFKLSNLTSHNPRFLSPQARQSMINVVNLAQKGREAQYNNLRNGMLQQLKTEGIPNAEDYLVNFEGGLMPPGAGENRVRVREKSSGRTGSVLRSELDPNIYDEIK